MPFRDAHHVTGRIVGAASKAGVALHEMPLQDMQAVEPKITAEALKVLSVEASVKSRTSYGGTAPKNVLAQAKAWLRRLEKQRKIGLSAGISLQFHDYPALARAGQSLYGAARIGDFVVISNSTPEPSGWAIVLLSAAALALGGLRTQGRARPAAEHPAAGGRCGAGRCRSRAGRKAPSVFNPTYGSEARAERPKGQQRPFILDPLLRQPLSSP